jgi:hypothetical protein
MIGDYNDNNISIIKEYKSQRLVGSVLKTEKTALGRQSIRSADDIVLQAPRFVSTDASVRHRTDARLS